MRHQLGYIIIFLSFIACEEVYVARMDYSKPHLVIDATITNEPEQNIVKLYRSYDFYGDRIKNAANWVEGALVIIQDEFGNEVVAEEAEKGNYWVDVSAKPGLKYRLIVTSNGETYESDYETLPDTPVFKSFRVIPDTIEEYVFYPTGEPVLQTDLVCRSLIDIPVKDNLPYNLFEVTLVLEYLILRPPPRPPVFLWKTFHDRNLFDVISLPPYNQDDWINGYTLCITRNKLEDLISFDDRYRKNLKMVGWIVCVDHFGLTEKTFQHFEVLNEQMQATGKLFDPVYPQIESNIRCTSNPAKNVIGFFKLNSYKKRRFFVEKLVDRDTIVNYETQNYFNIPFSGELEQPNPPDFWLTP